MVIESWLKDNFEVLNVEKDWLSLNDIEKQSIKNTIRARLNIKAAAKFLCLCNENESVLKLGRDIAAYVGLNTRINNEPLFNLIINRVIDNLKDSKINSQITAVTENFYPITYAKITARPKGQSASAAITWDFTSGGLHSWVIEKNLNSVSTTEIEVKLQYLRKDEVGLLILNKFFNAEEILKYMKASKSNKIASKARVVEPLGYSNIKMQLSAIDIINPAVVKICQRVESFMGNIDLLDNGMPTYYKVISSSLSVYHAEAELQGQSAAFLVFCEYISNQITQLCCMKIESNKETWDWTKESLNDFSKRYPSGNSITLQNPNKRTNKKLYLIFNSVAFTRSDLSIWGVPAAGKKEAIFWGDTL